MTTETRQTHYYRFYGRTLTGYGPSMDPHRCGDPSEPCWVVTETREVTPWVTTPTTETREDSRADDSGAKPPSRESVMRSAGESES